MPAELVDTNILVYAYDQTAKNKFDRSRQLMEKLWNSGEGVISTQLLEEFLRYGYGENSESPQAGRGARNHFGPGHLENCGPRNQRRSRGK